MNCLRQASLALLAVSFASFGCAASAEPASTTTTPGEDGATTGDDTEAPGDDTGATEDTAPPLEYPPGPYGKAVGAVIPNVTWEGYKDGVGEWTKLSLLDYYDPDGSRGINAIKIGGAALW
jgi:hypothetical protein